MAYGTMGQEEPLSPGHPQRSIIWIWFMFSTFTIVFAFAAGRASVEQKLTHVELSQTKVAMRPPPLRASDANVASTSMATVPLPPVREMGLWAVYESILKTRTFVDLTHSFDPAIPHWKGFQPETVSTLYNYDADGFWAQQFCHVGQWGTHLDPPAHFVKGKRTIDQIRPDEMLLPLVVIDVHDKVAANPDYTLSMSDIRAWETKHAQAVPEGAFVAMRTDWSKRWPDGAAMDNKDDDGVPHYPGWSIEVLRYLYEERKITASGHETTDTDPGVAVAKDDYSLETYILAQDRYQVELLSNLDKVPPIGALVVISFPKPKGASGFPARVFAILP